MAEKRTALERLEDLLGERDEKIEELETELAKAREEIEADNTWTRHRIYEDPKEAPGSGLPVPRLEVRWLDKDESANGYEIEAVYSLVYRHLLGHVVFIPLGLTRSTGALSSRLRAGIPDLPFRDGAHFRNEMQQFKLRGFGVVGDVVHEYKACVRCGRLDVTHMQPDAVFGPGCKWEPLDDWK